MFRNKGAHDPYCLKHTCLELVLESSIVQLRKSCPALEVGPGKRTNRLDRRQAQAHFCILREPDTYSGPGSFRFSSEGISDLRISSCCRHARNAWTSCIHRSQ